MKEDIMSDSEGSHAMDIEDLKKRVLSSVSESGDCDREVQKKDSYVMNLRQWYT